MRRASYRLQLRREFGFDDAAALVDYLDQLGISEVYCSPILQAVAGSTHGYDVVDHSRLSTDLGGPGAFARLVERARERAMGTTIDIVPNHMAIDGRANRWWWDILENGPSSLYARYFDIDWPGDGARHEQTVLVPVLGDRYGRVLERGEIAVERDGGSFRVTYFDHEWPLSPRTVGTVLAAAAEQGGPEPLAALAARFSALPHASMTDRASVSRRHDEKERLRQTLSAACDAETGVGEAIDAALAELNSDPDRLDRLLCRQNYRLAFWRTGREELDYRRFFNIESLVGLRVEDDQVFADTHETIARLVHDGAVDGLRVDHVDGLRDPEGYLQRLHRLAPGAYVAVEKILHHDEELPPWPVAGSTGYDFAARVANVFVDPRAEESMTSTYTRLTGEPGSYTEVVRAAKLQIMTDELAPEVDRLTRLLHGICDGHRRQRDRTRGEVHEALRAVLTAFPVYRTYVQPDRAGTDADTGHIADALRAAREVSPETDPDLLDFIGELLRLEWPGGDETAFAQMFPQLSAPVMAKGAEDTAFYRYNRLVSLNEVGGDPGLFGRSLDAFHADTAESARRHPLGMLALATHDTKRSPDVRARISLLSEMPEHWEEAVTAWLTVTDAHAGPAGPDFNARYLLLQTLVGTWPIGFDRLAAYMDKAAKEAKVHTSWADGNADYDYGLRKFVESTLGDDEFRRSFLAFLDRMRIVETGRATALAQHTLLLTCPGIPDIYQGSEAWDGSLVDPDNRRPVDFAALRATLDRVRGLPADALSAPSAAADLTEAKTWLTLRILAHRRERPEPYSGSEYEPLVVEGRRAEHLIAFSRGPLVVLVGRHLHRLGGDWQGTTVQLPPGSWHPVVGFGPPGAGSRQEVAALLGAGPVAVLAR